MRGFHAPCLLVVTVDMCAALQIFRRGHLSAGQIRAQPDMGSRNVDLNPALPPRDVAKGRSAFQVVFLFPTWVAPNVMTVTGWVLLVVNYLLILKFAWNMDEVRHQTDP